MSDTPTEPATTALSPHIEQTVQAIAKLHADHHRAATPLQRIVDRATDVVVHPWFLGLVAGVVCVWIGGNLLLQRFAGLRLDDEGFQGLQGAGELVALYITTLVLMSQRRKDELSELREQLILELAIMTEQKSAKLIALMEEMRRDSPHLTDRHDPQAADMATPADPGAVHEAFRETHEGMIAQARGTEGSATDA